MSLIRLDDEDRALELLLKRAKIISKVPGLKKEIAGNPDAVAAIMISNQQYGLGITIPAINMAFDWIEGTASPSALFYTAVGKIHGYYITPKERTREKAVAHVRHPSDPHDEPFDVEFGTAEAIDAHRLDEWVETRVETGRKYRDGNPVLERMVCTVTTNGVPVPLESLPVWAQELVDAGQVKRFDA